MRGQVIMRRTKDGLVPVGPEGQAILDRLKLGDRVLVKMHRPRSIEQSRLFWAFLTKVAEATEFDSPERLLTHLKVALGRYDLERLPDGRPGIVPHSISFASMSQDDFHKFFDESVKLICSEMLPGVESADLIAEIHGMLEPREPERAA